MSRVVTVDPRVDDSANPSTLPLPNLFPWKKVSFLCVLLVPMLILTAWLIPTTRWAVGSGYITTDKEVELRPSVEGAIAEQLTTPGQLVSAGQLLIQLNNTVQKAELEHALGELKTREAELTSLAQEQELKRAQLKQQISRAEQNLKLAQLYLDRMNGGGFSPKEVDEMRLKLDLATSQLAELRLPQDNVMEQRVAVLKEQIDTARKNVAVQEAQVRLREIRSPLTGVVLLNRFEPGEVVKPENVLGQVFDRNSWVVKFQLPELSIGQVEPGQSVLIALAAYPTLRYGYVNAKVTRILPLVTPRATGTGVFYVEAAITPPATLLIQPGMTATGYVNTGRTNWLYRMVGW